MPTTDAIKRRLNTAEDLRAIVRTMKALAAVNIRQYDEAVVSLADYARSVEFGFQVLLQSRPEKRPFVPPSPSRIGAIVLGSDHGLCGAFNEHVTAFYLERLGAGRRTGNEPLIAVGHRAAGRLEDANRRPEVVLALPASAGRIAAHVHDVLEHVAAWRDAGVVDAVRVYFNAPHGASGYLPREEQLLRRGG